MIIYIFIKYLLRLRAVDFEIMFGYKEVSGPYVAGTFFMSSVFLQAMNFCSTDVFSTPCFTYNFELFFHFCVRKDNQ